MVTARDRKKILRGDRSLDLIPYKQGPKNFDKIVAYQKLTVLLKFLCDPFLKSDTFINPTVA